MSGPVRPRVPNACNAIRLSRVRLTDGLERLQDVVCSFFDRQRAASFLEELTEVLPVQELHREERQAVLERAGVHDVRDVGALDARGRLDLARDTLPFMKLVNFHNSPKSSSCMQMPLEIFFGLPCQSCDQTSK